MPARDLRGFLVALDARGDLARVRLPVDANGEVAAAAARAADLPPMQRRALLFNQISGAGETISPFRVAANLYTTHERMALALNVGEIDEIRAKFARLFDFNFPRGSMGMMARLAEFIDLARSIGLSNGVGRKPPVQDIIHPDQPDAHALPSLKFSAREVYPSLTAALLIVRDARGMAQSRVGRAAVIDARTLAVQLDPADVAENLTTAPHPVAVVLGTDPALLWSASVPLPDGIDRALLAAWLRGKSVPFANAISQPLDIPAEAEAVVEGVLTGEPIAIEWIDDRGMLSAETLYRMHVTAITHRERAIIPINVPGSRDAYWMRRAAERLLLPILKTVLPDVIDLHQVDETLVIVQARPQTDMYSLIYGLWGVVRGCRRAVIVPPSVDIFDAETVINALAGGVEVVTAVDRFALIARVGKPTTRSDQDDTTLADRLTRLAGSNWALYGGRIAILGINEAAFEGIINEVRNVYPDLVIVGVNADINVCDLPSVLGEVIRWGWVTQTKTGFPVVRAFHAAGDEDGAMITARRWDALGLDAVDPNRGNHGE